MVVMTRIIFTVGVVICGAAATATEDINKNQSSNLSALEMQPLSPSRILHKYENENKAKLTKDKLKRKPQRWGLDRNPWRGMKALDFGRGTYGGAFGSKVPGYSGRPSDKVRGGNTKGYFSGTGISNKAFSYSGGKGGSGIPLVGNAHATDGHVLYDNSHESNDHHKSVGIGTNSNPNREGTGKTKLDLSGRGITGITGGKPLMYNYRFT